MSKEVILKAAGTIRELGTRVTALENKLEAYEKYAAAEDLAKKMVELGYVTSVEDYFSKVDELSKEANLQVVEEALKHGLVKNSSASSSLGRVYGPSENEELSDGELTAFLLEDL